MKYLNNAVSLTDLDFKVVKVKDKFTQLCVEGKLDSMLDKNISAGVPWTSFYYTLAMHIEVRKPDVHAPHLGKLLRRLPNGKHVYNVGTHQYIEESDYYEFVKCVIKLEINLK